MLFILVQAMDFGKKEDPSRSDWVRPTRIFAWLVFIGARRLDRFFFEVKATRSMSN